MSQHIGCLIDLLPIERILEFGKNGGAIFRVDINAVCEYQFWADKAEEYLLRKGWIERRDIGAQVVYRLTEAGETERQRLELRRRAVIL